MLRPCQLHLEGHAVTHIRSDDIMVRTIVPGRVHPPPSATAGPVRRPIPLIRQDHGW